MWAKYELIWSDITAQTVTLGANLLVMAETIPQNAHREFFFFLPKVAFTKNIWKIPKTIKNVPKKFKHNK